MMTVIQVHTHLESINICEVENEVMSRICVCKCTKTSSLESESFEIWD